MTTLRASLAAWLMLTACSGSSTPSPGPDPSPTPDASGSDTSATTDGPSASGAHDATTEPEDALPEDALTEAAPTDCDATLHAVDGGCQSAGSLCASSNTCCSGVCGAPETPDAAAYCAPTCTTPTECASLCCQVYRNTTVMVCQPIAFCGPK